MEPILPERFLKKAVAYNDPLITRWAALEVVKLYVLPGLLYSLRTGGGGGVADSRELRREGNYLREGRRGRWRREEVAEGGE
jgi:hypothetical protein